MPQRRLFLTIFLTGLGGSTLVSAEPFGSAGAPPLNRPVPRRREETVPAVRRGRLWEPGHWQWTGRDYRWIRGREIAARAQYRRYVHGEWVRRTGGWVWVSAHWE